MAVKWIQRWEGISDQDDDAFMPFQVRMVQWNFRAMQSLHLRMPMVVLKLAHLKMELLVIASDRLAMKRIC